MDVTRSKVVDLASYRAARLRAELPLFDETRRRALESLEAYRPLSIRQAEHRLRMIEHLGRARR